METGQLEDRVKTAMKSSEYNDGVTEEKLNVKKWEARMTFSLPETLNL